MLVRVLKTIPNVVRIVVLQERQSVAALDPAGKCTLLYVLLVVATQKCHSSPIRIDQCTAAHVSVQWDPQIENSFIKTEEGVGISPNPFFGGGCCEGY